MNRRSIVRAGLLLEVIAAAALGWMLFRNRLNPSAIEARFASSVRMRRLNNHYFVKRRWLGVILRRASGECFITRATSEPFPTRETLIRELRTDPELVRFPVAGRARG